MFDRLMKRFGWVRFVDLEMHRMNADFAFKRMDELAAESEHRFGVVLELSEKLAVTRHSLPNTHCARLDVLNARAEGLVGVHV